MKRKVFMVIFAPCVVWADAHIFSLPDGRALEAQIVGYDAKSGRVVLERKDGKRVKVSPSGFVDSDQRYIKNWVVAHAFLSDSTLKVACDDRMVKEWKEEETTDIHYSSGIVEENFVHNVIKYKQYSYDITLRNKGVEPIKGLVLEYCIYYEQSSMTKEEKPVAELKTFHGSMKVPDLIGDAPVTVTTPPVMIYTDNLIAIPQDYGDQRRPGKGEIIGVRARLVMKVGEKESIRELCEPDTLSSDKYSWTETTSPNTRKRSLT